MRLVHWVGAGILVVLAGQGLRAAEIKGYVAADAKGCMVWAPSVLSKEEYVPRYAGGCRDGHAEGKGKVE